MLTHSRKLPILIVLWAALFGLPLFADVQAAETAEAVAAAPSMAAPQAPSADGTAQLLDEQELAQLAAADEQPGDDVTGGALSNEHLTYIAIALATAIIVIIAVN